MTEFLTENQRKYGQRRYLFFALFNGLSVAFLAEGTLILYALKFGVPDYIVGFMSSFFFLGLPFIILGKQLITKIGASKTIATAWLLRNLSILLAASAPIITLYTSSFILGVVSILLGAFGFYAFRGIGSIGWAPMLGEVTTEEDRGKYNSTFFICFNAMYFLGILLIIIILDYWDSIRTFQIILTLGCVAGCYSAYNVLQVPESRTPKKSASVSIKQAATFLFKYPEGRKLMFAQAIYFTGMALTVPYSMISVKEGYGINDYNAMFFILVLLIGGLSFFVIFKKFLEKFTTRKILFALFMLMILAASLWAVAPADFYWWYCCIIFLITGAAQMGGFLILMTHFLNIIPPLKRVGSTLLISSISSLAAGSLAAIIGAGLLETLDNYLTYMNLFNTFFTIILVLLLVGSLVIYRFAKEPKHLDK